MFGGILQAIEGVQLSLGAQEGVEDAGAGNLVSGMTVSLQQEWMGQVNVWTGSSTQPPAPDPTKAHVLSQADLQNGYWYQDSTGTMTYRPPVMDTSGPFGTGMPITGNNFFTEEMQAAIKAIASVEVGKSGEDLTRLDAERQTWSSQVSVEQNIQQTQTQPLQTVAQTQASNVSGDNSALSSIASMANGMADLSGITASLVPNIK